MTMLKNSDLIANVVFDKEKFQAFEISRSSTITYVVSTAIMTVFVTFELYGLLQVKFHNTKILVYLSMALLMFSGWSLCFIKYYMATNENDYKSQKINENDSRYVIFINQINHFIQSVVFTLVKNKYIQILEDSFVVSRTLAYGLVLIFRSQYGPCGNDLSSLVANMTCNIEYDSKLIPSNLAAFTLLLSLASEISLKGASWESKLLSLAVGFVTILYSIYVTQFWGSLKLLFLMTAVVFVLMNEIRRQNIELFKLTESLHQTLEDNEKMVEELRLNEMKMMIGNVAHDLKTVCSFSLYFIL